MSAISRFPLARLMTASGFSNLADGMLRAALPLAALRLTSSPALIAGLSFALSLPWLVVTLPAGALIDRWDRRVTMLVANTVRGGALGLVVAGVAFGPESIWVLYAGAVLIGTAEVFYDTTAQSILPQVVPRDRLQGANGRLFALETTAHSFVGPPLGGVLAAVGIGLALGVPVALWVVAVLVLSTLRGTFRVERKTTTSLRGDVAEGLRFLWQQRVLRTLATSVGLSNLGWAASSSVWVLWAVGPSSTLGLNEAQYGVLLTALAIGSVTGSLVANQMAKRIGRTASLMTAMAASAIGLAAPLLTTNPVVIGALFAVSGVGMALWNVIAVSLRQRLTPDRLLGRLNSAYRLLAWGTAPIGAALGGALGEAFGIKVVFVVGTALTLAVIGLVVRLTPARLAAAEAAVDEPLVERAASGEVGPAGLEPTTSAVEARHFATSD